MAGLDISAATLAIWMASGLTPASDGDIAQIADLAGRELPSDYITFLQTYGFATWDDGSDPVFTSELGQSDIFQMFTAQEIARTLDQAPANHLPIAMDYSGHGFVLLQMEPDFGSVWHMDDGGAVGHVAPDFATFLADLAPFDDGPRVERWTGTPVTDKTSGFTIAKETRDAWAAYGTGATSEPADEMADIEATLGQPLPEALHTFLTTYGYVTFFGDAIASFALPDGAGQAQDDISVVYSTAVLPRALPLADGAPLPFASTALAEGSLLIGLSDRDQGHIYWQGTAAMKPIKVADDLRGFLGLLYKERPADD